MKLPFLFLSVVLLPLANAQGNIYVKEHNLTYSLGEGEFTVVENMLFENMGDPFTYEGSIYFLRGDARDVEVGGFPFEVIPGHPAVINITEFMISKGQRKVLTLRYRRSDLVSTEDGVTTFEGLSLGRSSWPVHLVRVTFIAPQGEQFGYANPGSGRLERGEREALHYEVSIFENVSAVLDGFPVRLEYADYRDLAGKELIKADALLDEAEFEIERANGSIENARSYGVNVTRAAERYSLSHAALSDAREKLGFSRIDYGAGRYPRAHGFALSASASLRAAIKEAAAAREVVNLEVQRLPDEKSEAGNQTAPLETVQAVQEESGGMDLMYAAPLIALAVLLAGAALVLRGRDGRPRTGDYAAIKDLKRKEFRGFEREVTGVKLQAEKSGDLRKLILERRGLEEGLEELRRKRARKRVNKKTFERERKQYLKKLDEIDSRRSRLEMELEKIRKETRGN